jgi:hypothetical protein
VTLASDPDGWTRLALWFVLPVQLKLDDLSAKGYIAMQALGEVKAVALLDASRKSRKAAWDYKSLKLEVDKYTLDQRTEKRREAAMARYGKDALAPEDAAAVSKRAAEAGKGTEGKQERVEGGEGEEQQTKEDEILTITLH